ncbi:hypothetical protein APX70_00318 [Pseudomonas syringae pv. maculicola]|uniref:Uncharacterized protein n=1 Tax=Pseudomonas syringae pv. maculicola TaxID=59511 RepID=A0A3M2ZLG0_PSEYM|nr:hypothetical protein APX70_00318 [Pseudomonas syringae pv. maculicola]
MRREIRLNGQPSKDKHANAADCHPLIRNSDNPLHFKRTFVPLVRKLLTIAYLALAGSKLRVFPTPHLRFEGLNDEKSMADSFRTGSVHRRR